MRTPRWVTTALAILGTAIIAAVAAAALPDNPYQRFSTLEATIQARIRWVYERIHEDPTPIDVAVLGSSRWGAAVDSPRLEASLARLGRPVTTVNFALPENGRDLQWVILQQLLAAKRPRLLVVGVTEKPSRFGHPAYKYVAPTADVIDPAYFGNLNYLANLAYLPFRQVKLFAARVFPAVFGLAPRPDPARYAGTNITAFAVRNDAGTPIDRDHPLDRAVLEAQVRRYERGLNAPLLSRRFADIEFGDDRVYLQRMMALARARGIKVVFLFLPYYSGPSVLQERALYTEFGPILDASFLARHPEFFADVAHVNRAGASALTDWLAPRIAALMPDGSINPGISSGQLPPAHLRNPT